MSRLTIARLAAAAMIATQGAPFGIFNEDYQQPKRRPRLKAPNLRGSAEDLLPKRSKRRQRRERGKS